MGMSGALTKPFQLQVMYPPWRFQCRPAVLPGLNSRSARRSARFVTDRDRSIRGGRPLTKVVPTSAAIVASRRPNVRLRPRFPHNIAAAHSSGEAVGEADAPLRVRF